MIEYERKVYPEIDKQEFDESIQPLLRSMEELHIEKKDKEESFYSESLEFNNEQYPYHNSCFLLSKEIWERYWDDSLNEYLSDYDKFENETLLIKYDVEGSEEKAILGSIETIKKNNTTLAISIYHRSRDIFSIPILISSLFPNSKMIIKKLYGIPDWDILLYVDML